MHDPVIETERLVLRRWKREDREFFSRLNADPRVMEFMLACLSAAESDQFVDRIENHFCEHGFGLFAVEFRPSRIFIGFAGLQIPRFKATFMPCVEIGWRLSPEHWGLGLATEASRAIVRHSFEDLGLDSLVSFTFAGNVRSRRVMEKIGMTHDPSEDFEHPGLPPGHPLRPHVLYRLKRSQ